MKELLEKIYRHLREVSEIVSTDVPEDYRPRIKENLREAENAVYRMREAVEEYSFLPADYQKR